MSDFLERCPFCKEYLLSWQVKEHKHNAKGEPVNANNM